MRIHQANKLEGQNVNFKAPALIKKLYGREIDFKYLRYKIFYKPHQKKVILKFFIIPNPRRKKNV